MPTIMEGMPADLLVIFEPWSRTQAKESCIELDKDVHLQENCISPHRVRLRYPVDWHRRIVCSMLQMLELQRRMHPYAAALQAP